MSIVNVVVPDADSPAVSPEVVPLHAPVDTPVDASVCQGSIPPVVSTEKPGSEFGSNVALSKSYDPMTLSPSHIDTVGAEDSVGLAVGHSDVVGFGDDVGDAVGPPSHW